MAMSPFECQLLALSLLLAVGLLVAGASGTHIEHGNETEHFGELHYMILVPRTGRLGSAITVSCALLTGDTISSARARLFPLSIAEGHPNVSVENSWTRGSGDGVDYLTLSLVLENNGSVDLQGNYRLSVELTASSGSIYRNTTVVQILQPRLLTFVQTDKALYQPGQTVKFRVLCLNDSLRPVATNFTVLIKDAQGNLVDRFLHEVPSELLNASQAVMRGQFELADPPLLGTWRIEVSGSRGQRESKSFSVERYTLPKFTVELTTPDFVHVGDAGFNVTVAVRYTYRQAVHGQLQADIGPWSSCTWCKQNYNLLKHFNVALNGEDSALFTFPMAEWRTALVERANKTGTTFDMSENFDVKVDVQFTEKFSAIVKTATASFKIYGAKYKLSMETPGVQFFLPGMRLPVKLLLQRPNDVAYTGSSPADVRLWIEFAQRGKPKSLELFRGQLRQSDSGTGLSLLLTVPDCADFTEVIFRAKLLDSTGLEASASVRPYLADTNEFVATGLLSDANGVRIFANQSSGIKAAFYAIVSQDQIRSWSKLDSQAHTSVLLSAEQIQDFIPSFSAVTFGIADSGEIVASYAEHSLASVSGKLTLSSNLTNDTAEPQAGVSIDVRGEPHSFVFLTGIDASVNLIRTGQDLLESTVADKLKAEERPRFMHQDFGSGCRLQSYSTGSILQHIGLQLLTDGFFTEDNGLSCSMWRPDFPLFDDVSVATWGGIRLLNEAAPAPDFADGTGAAPLKKPEKSQKRAYFPETMLWTMLQTDASGRASEALRLPDTITSWDVTAFGVSSERAIQTVQRPFQVTTFKSFFVQPTLPHSMIRGESLLLRLLLFNYDSASGLTANVTLTLDQEAFELKALTGGQSAAAASSVEVGVEANGVGLAVFSLRPKRVAEASVVTVRARAVWPDSRVEVDEVIRTLPVLPEGRTVRRARTTLLSLRGSVGSNSSTDEAEARSAELKIDWPEAVQPDGSTLVPGSQLLSMAIVGDVLGPAMDGIGSLVRTPHGCGEQNMVDFAPAIAIYRYLRSDQGDAATAQLRQKAMDAMRTGYQRELTFRRDDGSYSAFGNSDSAGSVWLTAFVLSSYAQAAEFIAVDPAAVTGSSLKFLLSRQDASGRFTEPEGARLLDSGLQGESGKASLGMSAFICAALVDIRDAVTKLPGFEAVDRQSLVDALNRCVNLFNVEFSLRRNEFDTRDLALSAYFLLHARRSGFSSSISVTPADGIFAAFNDRAQTEDDLKYWKVKNASPFWISRESLQPSEEVTAYGVLAAMLAHERPEAAAEAALPALRWLTGRQTSSGGFSNTQSTVVGIRAIAAFAEATGASSRTSATVRIPNSGAVSEPIIVDIEPTDRRVLRRRLLARGDAASGLSSVNVSASGSGLVLATVAWQFNLRDPQDRQLVANWTEVSGLGLRLGAAPKVPNGAAFAFSVCVRASGPAGMYILRIANPSGYAPETFTGAGSVSGLQLVEAGPQELVFYFNKLTETEVCVNSAWRRDIPVLNVQPQKITLQKYYQPELANTLFYLDPELQSVGRCQVCPDCPGCQQAIDELSSSNRPLRLKLGRFSPPSAVLDW